MTLCNVKLCILLERRFWLLFKGYKYSGSQPDSLLRTVGTVQAGCVYMCALQGAPRLVQSLPPFLKRCWKTPQRETGSSPMRDGFSSFSPSKYLQKCQKGIKQLICPPWVSFPKVARKTSRPGLDVSKQSLVEKHWECEYEEDIQDCDYQSGIAVRCNSPCVTESA